MLESVLLATLTPLVWSAGLLMTARLFYQKARPSKVPLCNSNHKHLKRGSGNAGSCYRRYSDIDTETEAVVSALFAGSCWPLVVLFLGAKAAITGGAPEFPEEKAARLENLKGRIHTLEKEGEEKK